MFFPMKKILISLLLVLVSIVLTILIFQLIHIINGNPFSLEELTYTLVLGGVSFILPFFFFFLIFGFVRNKLSSQSASVLKLPGQLLIGLGLAVACILFLTLVTFIARGLSWHAMAEYVTDYFFFVVFVVVVVVLNYCYELYNNKHKIKNE